MLMTYLELTGKNKHVNDTCILCKILAWASQCNLSQIDTSKLDLIHKNLLWLEFCREIADRLGIDLEGVPKKLDQLSILSA
jgi:hypothetical protein